MAESVLHVFTRDGATFTFRAVEIETKNETLLVFTYRAASDARRKRGTFFTRSLAGWSIAIE